MSQGSILNNWEGRKKKYLGPIGSVPLCLAPAQIARGVGARFVLCGALHVQGDAVLSSNERQANDITSLCAFVAARRALKRRPPNWAFLFFVVCDSVYTWLQGPANHLPLQSFADTQVRDVSGRFVESQSTSLCPEQWALRVWMPVPHSSEHWTQKRKEKRETTIQIGAPQKNRWDREINLSAPFGEKPRVGRTRSHIADIAGGGSLGCRAVGIAHLSSFEALTQDSPVSHAFAATCRALLSRLKSFEGRGIYYCAPDVVVTLPHSVACHFAQVPGLQLRTRGTDGAGLRQAASFTLMVSVGEISCLHVISRVCTPSPQDALHGLQSPNTHLFVTSSPKMMMN